jgi:opacity protein-like surface antigen
MRRLVSALMLAAVCIPSKPAHPEDLEIGAFYGQRLGGGIGPASLGGSEIQDLDVAEGDGYGLTVEYTFPNQWRMEFIWDTQDSYLSGDLDGNGKARLAETSIDNYLFGGNYYFSRDAFQPFIGFHLGATRFQTDGLGSQSHFAYSLGGGAKYALTDTLILDFRARWVASYIESENAVYCSLPGACYIVTAANTMDQFHFTAGLNFRF